MKTRLVSLILIAFAVSSVFSRSLDPITPATKATPPSVINFNDSLIFDLASATITATYIDIPIYAKSDDVIFGIDYAIQFNMSKLTFSSTIDLLPADTTMLTFSYFNPNNLFLKYGSSSLINFPATGSPVTFITKIRFTLSAPCTPVTAADFFNIDAFLNGVYCAFKVTPLNFSQFIPIAGFSNNPPCLNSNIQFSNTSTLTTGTFSTFAWNFGNGSTAASQNPSTTYTATGTAPVSLTVTSAIGCTATTSNILTVNAVPVSSFSHSFNCLTDSVLFTNSSSMPSGSITGTFWDFGDNSTSTLTDPTHHYNASGLFTVTLISTSNFSCTATSTTVVNLTNKVVASFTTTSVNNCVNSVINFIDASTYSLSSITAWSWDFGDGVTSNLQSPAHTFTAPGTYSVNLTSTGGDGCKGTITQVILINGPPTVQFSASSLTLCAGVPVTFTDQSITPANSTYVWHFGDDSTSTAQNPVHTYSLGGSYPIKLVVTTPGGCKDSLTKPAYLTINHAPAVNFSLSTTCILVNINFINHSTITTGTIVSWLWNLGNSVTSNLQSPSSSYSLAGTYTVSLSATSDLGCVGNYTQAITATTKPNVNFSATNGQLDCSGQAVNFTNLSTPAVGPAYVWRFGDNSTSVLQQPVHTYSLGGSYAIQLTVINPGGCSDSLTKPYTVSVPLPAIALFADSVTANAVVSFTSLSTNAVNVAWDFGDSQNSILDSPIHTFADAATYNVCLTAYNILNCPNTLCKDIYVGLSSIVAIPSAFTPNDDNVNDVLRVRGGPFLEMEFKVLNEWGNLLFSSTSQSLGWDGRFNGEAQPVGVYEYILRGKTLDKKNINLYGAVNLTR